MPPHRKPKHRSAREKLQLSHLDLSQMELMGDDIDLEGFYLEMKGKTGIQAIDRVTRANVTRTIEGASTLEVDVKDPDLELLNSPLLHSHCDVRIDGLWFRLCKIEKQQDTLTLTFEDREIAVLRTYTKPIKQSGHTSRNKGVTRAEFILRLLREVKEFKIPYVIPELHKAEEIDGQGKTQDKTQRHHHRQYGIADGEPLTVKGSPMKPDQRKNANIVLDTAVSMNCPTPVMVMSMMAAIQESRIRNLPQPKPGDDNYRGPIPSQNPVGVFQQIKAYNWPATRDVAKDAHEFLKRMKSEFAAHRSLPYYDQIEAVQHSGHPRYYAAWHPEAERIVAAYFGGDAGNQQQRKWDGANGGQNNEYEYYRGKPEQRPNGHVIWKPESSWECIQRLASEVNKLAFFVSGTFYYISEPELFKSQPNMDLRESDPGVDWIDFDWDINKSYAELQVTCEMGRWAAPPGSVVKIEEMGTITGRWLVDSAERSIYDRKGLITLIKPSPALPEPAGGNTQQDASGKYGLGGDPPGQGHSEVSQGGGYGSEGSYQNPFARSSQLQAGRTDMGVDYHGVGPILAIGPALIIGNGGAGWPGRNYLLYRLLGGPHKGKYIYVAESIVPRVHAGQRVAAGEVIATFGDGARPGAFPGIEMGWSSSTMNLTRAKATEGYSEGDVTRAGKAFARLLIAVGAPVANNPGPGPEYV